MSHHESSNESTPHGPLPAELLAAIDRAKQRRATTEAVENLTERLLRSKDGQHEIATGEVEMVSPVQRAFWKRPVAWGFATAVALLIAVAVSTWWPAPKHVDPALSEMAKTPLIHSYSTVTKVSLVDVAYQQMVDDLDRVDSEVEEVSEGLQLAALRHEIEVTLDDFYDRSK
jgi:hypothetical protein